MKKKILSIMLCLYMVLTMVTLASAADEQIPKVETDKAHTIIIQEGSDYRAFAFTNYSVHGGTDKYINMEGGYEQYSLKAGAWELIAQSPSDNALYVEGSFASGKVRYDTTGAINVTNPLKFPETKKPVGSADIAGYFSKLQEQIKVTAVVQVLVFVAVAIVGIAFMWWGVRKTARVIMTAFRKGKINL